ncbi:non-ribosomal peptide synthetase [Candidimonas nitroreducens]|uniref:Non-ribosomal peptide synthetase n=1 Tax=Candidimonas nitroreducens TaxID=683354 RepID=A0A225MLQ0_9BURK|nr:non-ribosomal peptide synthetase [Candidimonas nitroreducens]OWT62095.1 non-ribosomal peptide synthetase [Candidimonas nitroreducens]
MSSGYVAAASFAQRQLRYLDLLQPGGIEYAVPLAIEISGPVNQDALCRALQAVIARHDVLRAALPLADGVPVLAVRDDLQIDIPLLRVEAPDRAQWQQALAAAVTALAAQPFDLDHGPLCAAQLLCPSRPAAAGCSLALLVVMHHAVADGTSLPIFLDDLVAAYDACVGGAEPRWPELPLQYPDYADWEQEQYGEAGAPALAEALRYWREQLQNVPPLLDLPLDRRRGANLARARGATARLVLPAASAAAIDDMARRHGATPFMAYLAIFFAVLHRWSGLDDLVVTVPVSKRTRPELARLVGLLVDTLPLRLACTPDTGFDTLLGDVHRTFLAGVRHRDAPFQRIVQAIGIERRTDVVPLMQVLFGALEQSGVALVAADGTRFAAVDDQAEQAAKSDISFVYRQQAQGTELWCRYDPSLFDHASIQGLLAWFAAAAGAVALAPALALGDLPLIDARAGRELIARYNDNRRPYPADSSVAELFAETARRYPGHPAVDDGGTPLSYAELAQRAGRLAAALAARGVAQGDAVVLIVPLSARYISLVLAILELGATYVPLDPSHPHAHRARLAAAVGARAVIVQDEETAEGYGASATLHAARIEAEAAALQAPHPAARPASGAAYVMFTSGSTGEPKGVAVPHKAIARLVRNTDFAEFGPRTRAAVYSNPSFDASTLELWAPLLNGGTAVIVERRAMLEVAELRRTLAERNITLLWITAGLFHEIAGIDPAVFAGQRLVLTGGDAVNPAAARAVTAACAGSGLRLMNGYGPTENTTFSTTFDIGALDPDGPTIPIGRPIANSTAYILDRRGQPLPTGVNGEIYVGGDGVALGYVGDPQRTAAAFLPDPYAGVDGARMYRTGDHGRWRPDGTILFAGRTDDQVKVRGFRIELNEIAAALGRHPALRAVHVAAPRQAGSERSIVAYVVPLGAAAPTPAELRQFLEPLLPAHMLPQAYVATESLALNLNGKVDRKALPPIEDRHYDRSTQIVSPRTDEEATLHGIWRELLGLESVSVTDDFFHVGGDSILAIRMAARAVDAGLPLTPTDVFQLQSIERLAAAAGAARQPRPRRGGTEQVFAAELVPQTLPGQSGARPAYVLASLALDRPVSIAELAFATQLLAERHEALRLRAIRDSASSRLEVMAYVAQLPIRTVEAPGLDDTQIDDWVAAHAERIGRGLDPNSGVMIAATLVDRGPADGPVAVIALHRAAADEHSAALILAELDTALKSGSAALAAPDTSYGLWLQWLQAYADRQAADGALAVLESPAMRTAATPELSSATDCARAAARCWLDADTAAALAGDAPRRLRATLPDLLAAALAAALPQAPGGPARVLIEALNGRGTLPPDAPASDGLVGMLDAPLLILAPIGPQATPQHLRAVKSARQAVQAGAPVYAVLGQTFDLPAAALGVAWSDATAAHPAMRLHSLPAFSPSVRGMLLARAHGGRITLEWFGAEPGCGAAKLLQRVSAELQRAAALAAADKAALYTPADFPLAALSDAELERIVADGSHIQDIYPLSPMQEAMLVHTLAAEHSEINFEQSCVRMRGPLDLEAFRHAWATVFERHDVLRTAFHWRGLARPLQVVHRSVALPMQDETWPAFDAARLEDFLARDRARGFRLEEAPLVRLHVIRCAPDETYVVSSFHHLLVDGWCLGRLEREVRAAYETYRGRPPLFDAPVPYRAYIAWLAQADQTASRRFFAELLADLPAERRLYAPPQGPARSFATARLALDRGASRALTAFARRRGLTLAATLHFAWAVWLGARLGSDDVVFGTTVSGRPAGIAGVENIVGLFINNLPVRLDVAATAACGARLAAMQSLLGQLQAHAHLPATAVAEAAGRGARASALFDTLVVVENIASGTSAWSGAQGLVAEPVHSRLKTAYDLTFIAVPGDSIVLSLVQPEDGRELEDGHEVLRAVAAILTALPEAADGRIDTLPRPEARPAPAAGPAAERRALRFATRPRSTLEARIAAAVADLALRASPGAEAADLDTDFWRLGVTSLELVQLAARLEQALERPVPISLLLEHRSVAALARAIESGQAWNPIVPMSAAAPRTAAGGAEPPAPFVCVHPVAGDVSVFLDLARAMPPSIPFWAIQAAGLEEGQEPLSSVEALAQANLQALQARGQPQPRWIGGYSFGGIVAFEMARQLAAQGRAPEMVVIIDTPAPLERASVLDPDADRAHAQWLARMADVRARFQGLEPVLEMEELLALPAAERFDLAVRRLHAARILPPAASARWLQRAHRTSLVQYDAYLAYAPRPEPVPGLRLALIRASTPLHSDLGDAENRQLALADLGWGCFTDTPIPVHQVQGDHVTILGPDSAAEVAAAVMQVLQAEPRKT